MKTEKLDMVRGSGNVFSDLRHENADVEQFKAILAAEIIKALDRDGLSVCAAHRLSGVAAADFSRIRNADLRRFTNRFGSRVEVKLRVRRADPPRDDGLSRARAALSREREPSRRIAFISSNIAKGFVDLLLKPVDLRHYSRGTCTCMLRYDHAHDCRAQA